MNLSRFSGFCRYILEFFNQKQQVPEPTRRHVVFIDGDQSIKDSFRCYSEHLSNGNLKGAKIEFVQALSGVTRPPKKLKRYTNIRPIILYDFSTGKRNS